MSYHKVLPARSSKDRRLSFLTQHSQIHVRNWSLQTTLEPPVPNFSCLTPPARFAASEQPPAPKSKRTMSRVASLDQVATLTASKPGLDSVCRCGPLLETQNDRYCLLQWMEDPYGVEESATATSLATRGTLLEDVAENSQVNLLALCFETLSIFKRSLFERSSSVNAELLHQNFLRSTFAESNRGHSF